MRVLGLAFLLCLLNAGAAIPQAPTAATAIAAAAALFAEQQPAAVADAPEKAISRTDKMTVDLTGTVIGAYLPADICHTGDTAILYLRVKGVPVAIACFGPAFPACVALAPGKRVRAVGTLAFAPDASDPAFNPCDPNTWLAGGTNFLFLTKLYTK